MTCLKYGQCHYWFNLNRPLVIVPSCGSPWMLKWLTWLKNSGGKINPARFVEKKKKEKKRSYAKQVRRIYALNTGDSLFRSLFNGLLEIFKAVICSSYSVATLCQSCIIMSAIMKWSTLKMSCTGPFSSFPPPSASVWSSEAKRV